MSDAAAARTENPLAWRRQFLLGAVIAAVTIVACSPALRGGFSWDDAPLLTGNPLIHASDGLRRFWLTQQPTDYFPLMSTMLWVEWRLWGNDPTGYHVVNVLLHAAGAVLVWQVLQRLRVPGAWLAGALFAVHPVAVASAAWISERKNTLSLVLYLLAILAWMKAEGMQSAERRTQNAEQAADRAPRVLSSAFCILQSAFCTPSYLLSLALFLLALLAKTSVVMLPVVLLLCAWWLRREISRRDIIRSVPFFALSLALGLVTIWFQQHKAIAEGVVRPEGVASRIAAAGWIVWFDLSKVLFPVGLCAIYPRWDVSGSSALAWLPLLLLAVGMMWLWLRRKSPSAVSPSTLLRAVSLSNGSGPNGWGRAPLFALAYFTISLLPVLGLVDMSFMRYAFAADHLQYVAMIGVVALAAGVLAQAGAAAGWNTQKAGVGALALVVALGALGFQRAAIYAHEQSLWQDNLDKNPVAWVGWVNLGVAKRTEWEILRAQHGAPSQAQAGLADDAIRCFDRAIKLKGDCADAYANRGYVFDSLGRLPELHARRAELFDLALRDYNKAVELRPDWPIAYGGRGKVFADAGQLAKAEEDYTKAITLQPDYAFTYYVERGNLRAAAGRFDEAIRDYDSALALEPDFAEVYCNRGDAYDNSGRAAAALRDYDKAISLKPNLPEAYYDRAMAYDHLGEYGKALMDLDTCERLHGNVDPAFREALMKAAGRQNR